MVKRLNTKATHGTQQAKTYRSAAAPLARLRLAKRSAEIAKGSRVGCEMFASRMAFSLILSMKILTRRVSEGHRFKLGPSLTGLLIN